MQIIYIYIYTNLPVNAIVRLPDPRNGDNQGQETFLAPSAMLMSFLVKFILGGLDFG